MTGTTNYPIAEIFTSVQGEGQWTGTRMTFVRLAGCTVGKPYGKLDKPNGLEIYQEKCTLWDGREFPCDTNYKKTATMTVEQILNEVGDEVRVCITGGEPLMHDLLPLLTALHKARKMIHLETSGTISLEPVRSDVDWITVSPKQGVLQSSLMIADEVKFLIDERFQKEVFEQEMKGLLVRGRIWFQPVNGLHEIDDHNLKLCQDLQATYKSARISVQMHKWLKVR